jgi:hypothetical protein
LFPEKIRDGMHLRLAAVETAKTDQDFDNPRFKLSFKNVSALGTFSKIAG